MEFFAHMRLILKKGDGRQGLPCPEVRTPFLRDLGTVAQHKLLVPSESPTQTSNLLSPWGTFVSPAPAPTDFHLALPPLQVLLRSGSPAPAEPVDLNRGLRTLTQEEVISVCVGVSKPRE